MRRYLTLIELLIVLVLISLIATVIGIGTAKAVDSQRFESGVSLIVDQIQLAEELMLHLNTDVALTLTTDSKGVMCFLEVETGVLESLRLKERAHLFVRGVKAVSWDEEVQESLILTFLSAGGSMSKGLLHLAPDTPQLRAGKGRWVYLPGRPSTLQAALYPPVPSEEVDPPYPQGVLKHGGVK